MPRGFKVPYIPGVNSPAPTQKAQKATLSVTTPTVSQSNATKEKTLVETPNTVTPAKKTITRQKTVAKKPLKPRPSGAFANMRKRFKKDK